MEQAKKMWKIREKHNKKTKCFLYSKKTEKNIKNMFIFMHLHTCSIPKYKWHIAKKNIKENDIFKSLINL